MTKIITLEDWSNAQTAYLSRNKALLDQVVSLTIDLEVIQLRLKRLKAMLALKDTCPVCESRGYNESTVCPRCAGLDLTELRRLLNLQV